MTGFSHVFLDLDGTRTILVRDVVFCVVLILGYVCLEEEEEDAHEVEKLQSIASTCQQELSWVRLCFNVVGKGFRSDEPLHIPEIFLASLPPYS